MPTFPQLLAATALTLSLAACTAPAAPQPAPPRPATTEPTATLPRVATTVTPKPAPYPKEVPMSSIKDYRFRYWLGENRGQITAVELAPGVYSERGANPDLGTLADYSTYVGLCTDVMRYEVSHPGNHECW